MLRFKKESGASMVEATIILGVLLTFTLGAIEIGRYYMTKAIMQRAAKRGLELAIRHDDLLIDYMKASSEDQDKLRAAFQQIEEKVFSFEDVRASHNIAGTKVFFHKDTAGSGSIEAPVQRVIVLRPGDSGEYLDGSTTREVLHPTYAARVNGDNMTQLLRTHPILVELNGVMPSLLPFLGDIPIRVEAMGMAEIPPIGIQGVPGQDDFIPPSCGNGIFEPDFEQCEHIGSQGVTDIKKECGLDCRIRNKCGNGRLDLEAGEECDRANPRNTGGQSCEAYLQEGNTRRRWCAGNCKIFTMPKCNNWCIDPGEPCDIRRSRQQNIQAGMPPNQQCYRPVGATDETLCQSFPLPNCPDGVLLEVTCPAGSPASLRCYDCVGEGEGRCQGQIVNRSSPCHPESTTPLADSRFCDGCHQIEDLCNNGVLGDWPGEECEAGLGGVSRTLLPHEYCSSSCKIETNCGNSVLDAGEACDPSTDEPFDWAQATYGSGIPCDQFCTCTTTCTVVRPTCLEPGQTNCPTNTEPAIIPGSDPVECHCCSLIEGGGCVAPLSPAP